MATPYIVITDGTTTCTINTSAGAVGDYALEDWVPAIAGLRTSQLGGRGPYEEVIEEMTITIIDTTAAGCYTRLDTLNRLLDQAERWYLGENLTAVLIKYSPGGAGVSSSGTPLQAAILGRAPGNTTSGVGIRVIEKAQFTFHLPITLRFWRRGQWLLSTTADASSATNNGAIATCDLTAALDTPGPTKIQMTGYVSDDTDTGYLIITSNDTETRLSISDPTDGATGAPWTTSDESANFAPFTNILRYTPAGTTEVSTTTNPTNITNPARLVAIFMSVRNNSNSTSYLMRVKATTIDTYKTATTPYTYIAPYTGSAQPRWEYLGMVAIEDVETLTIYLTASAASGTIDIGSVCLVEVGYPYTYILTYKPTEANGIDKTLVIDHRLLTHPTPSAYSTYSFDVKGDMVIYTKDQNLNIVALITDTVDNDWRTTKAAAVNTNTFTATRYTGYLSPR